MELIPDIKSYDWGKLGDDSEVAALALANGADANDVDATLPYAEWWIGDHVSGPARVRRTGESLAAVIGRDPTLIGAAAGAPDAKLPFLLKVLSIRKALSIQVHPSKEVAEALHRDHPDLYKDPNHKPELAIALTPFLALCGFRPHAEIYAELQRLPPLVQLIGAANLERLHSDSNTADGLKQCFATLMHSTAQQVSDCIRQLTDIFTAKDFTATLESGIFLHLQRDFPDDVGSLSLFFLNVLRLQPGQAIFLPAREPHAYLDGNCVECMACSDNVIRAGLTPKFKDVDQLLRQLNYVGAGPDTKVFQPRRVDAYTEVFVPAVPDFAVAKITMTAALGAEYEFRNRRGGSVLLVLAGAAELSDGATGGGGVVQLQRGSAVFLPATWTTVRLRRTANDGGDGEFVAYQAMYNDFE